MSDRQDANATAMLTLRQREQYDLLSHMGQKVINVKMRRAFPLLLSRQEARDCFDGRIADYEEWRHRKKFGSSSLSQRSI